MMMTKMSDPWQRLSHTSTQEAYECRRVSEDLNPSHRPLDWAVSEEGNRALLIGYGPTEQHPIPLPQFRGLQVQEDCEHHLLKVELSDSQMLDAFVEICIDLVRTLQPVPESRLKRGCLERLDQWANLFQAQHRQLSEMEQRGLIAELIFLRDVLQQYPDNPQIIDAWVGPDDAPHDFVFGNTAVEVKSFRDSSSPYVTISSGRQLNVGDGEQLFLFTLGMNPAVTPSDQAVTLTECVQAVQKLLPATRQLDFELKCASLGYSSEQDYSAWRWELGNRRYFAVTPDFPHIDEAGLSAAIIDITYTLDLDRCSRFEINRSMIFTSLENYNA